MLVTIIGCLMLGLGGLAQGAAKAYDSLAQGPIIRVLRDEELPFAKNEELPSGALTLPQFVADNGLSRDAQQQERTTLRLDGFVSSAVSEFSATGQRMWRSAAIEMSSPGHAKAAVEAEARLALTQRRAEDAPSLAADTHFGCGELVTYRPISGGAPGGVALFACRGDYAYELRVYGKPDHISVAASEQLLNTVISRS